MARYYAASANPHELYPSLKEAIRCDACIVGGGFSGLSCALHLVEAGYDVVVLEAAPMVPAIVHCHFTLNTNDINYHLYLHFN